MDIFQTWILKVENKSKNLIKVLYIDGKGVYKFIRVTLFTITTKKDVCNNIIRCNKTKVMGYLSVI